MTSTETTSPQTTSHQTTTSQTTSAATTSQTTSAATTSQTTSAATTLQTTSAATTSAQPRPGGDIDATASSDFIQAILNILDDVQGEREHQVDTQRAVLNILEDIDTEKIRLESTQKALLNILDDFDVERHKVDKANLALQEVNESMRGFIAVAAHDLRSPLASMVGFSSLLTENWDTLDEENRLKFVTTIDRQSHKLSDLVNDILALSSIDGGVMNTQPELIVLRETITACLRTFNGENATVGVSCPPDLLVRVDPLHLERILNNYLQNALKYGEPPVRIEATQQGDMAEIRVLDHGPGVPPDFEGHLFGKFARADVPNTREKKGSGLGLSIVRGLAEANGGQARYEPNVPNGACFIVLLPVGEGRSR